MPKSDKCFSSCRQVSKDKCNPPRCSYINGEKHKYCRLTRKYTLSRSKDGHCITKKRESSQEVAKRKIGKFMISAHKKMQMEKKRLAQISKIRKSLYGRQLNKFMHNVV